MDSGITRRQALVRGGIALGALAVPSLGATPPAAAAPARRRGFDATRRATYVALVSTLGASPDTPIDASRARWAAARVTARYSRQSPEVRDATDAVLDALDRAGFRRMARSERVELLRAWARAGGREGDLAVRAGGLAALPFTPVADAEDDVIKPVPVVL